MRASGYAAEPHDWYQEQPRDVEDFLGALSRENLGFKKDIVWDPACGGGNIPNTLKRYKIRAKGTDLVDRGAGFAVSDFMDFKKPYQYSTTILSNPPFQPIVDWIRHANMLVPRVIFLARLALLEGQERRDDIWSTLPPTRVWVCSRRLSMPPGGKGIKPRGGSIPCAWFEWDRRIPPPLRSGMPRPEIYWV